MNGESTSFRGESIGGSLSSGGRRRRDVLVTGADARAVRETVEGILTGTATRGEGAVVVSTRDPPKVVSDRYGLVQQLGSDRLGVVDCTRKPTGVDADPNRLRWAVPSPADLGASGMALTESMRAVSRRGVDRIHVVYDSLSTALQTTDVDSVLQFAHRLTATTDVRGGLGLYPVYAESTSDRTLERLKELFDAVVRVDADDSRTVRCRGLTPASD